MCFFSLQTSRETGSSFHWHPPPFISSIIPYQTINMPLQELIYSMTIYDYLVVLISIRHTNLLEFAKNLTYPGYIIKG